MEGFNKKEYQTIVLAALLHDIGKLLHRGKTEYDGSHEDASFTFIEEQEAKLNNSNLYDLNQIRILVKYHHSTRTEAIKNKYFEDKSDIEQDRIWQLLKIVTFQPPI